MEFPKVQFSVHCGFHCILLHKIIRLHPHIKFYFYADDAQLYIHLSHKNASAALAKLNACLLDVQ